VVKVASLRLEMGGTVGLMKRAEISGDGGCTWGGYQVVERVDGVVCEVATHSR
jgi:hypothetical protein